MHVLLLSVPKCYAVHRDAIDAQCAVAMAQVAPLLAVVQQKINGNLHVFMQ